MADKAQAAAKPAFQRKTILIKKGLQYRYMALITMSVLVAFLIVGLDLIWTISKLVNERPMMQPMLEEMASMGPLFLIKMIMYMVIVLIMSAVVSHRMAGPIFKFEKSCATLAEGDLTYRVWLRKGDHLEDLQEQFNNMAGALQQSVKDGKASVAGVKARLEAAAARPEAGPLKAELEAAAAELGGVLTGLKT
ncbi:MAG: methyl-accepting chemotaxis protein [Elusimicrobiales bacterium]|jgi:methyl-accepting chemotaxis protein|nr:methyl-accepting chemotaxis protein [Elusimicrobiales bacterium]